MVQRVANGQADKKDYGIEPRSRVTRLSKGQIDCLLLVDQHHSSKEIAVRLGISPHTVDQRIRGALDKLGVERRGEAARLVAAAISFDDRCWSTSRRQSSWPGVRRATRATIAMLAASPAPSGG